MSNYIDEFLIAVGIDAADLESGIDGVQKQVKNVAKAVQSEMPKVAQAAQQSASQTATAFQGVGKTLLDVKEAVLAFGGAFLVVNKALSVFRNFVDRADQLGKLSTQLGISVSQLDAFGKAAEAAGGSAESMFSTMQSFYEKTGRPATEVFRLASRVEGMSRAAAQRYLQAQGVAADAIPIFLQGKKAMDALMAKYRQTAFTAKDAQTARAFKTAWMDFGIAAQSVGYAFARVVLPFATKAVEMLTKFVDWIRSNLRFLTLFGIGLGAVFGAKNLSAIKNIAIAVRAFGVALKGALLPITAVVAGVAALALAIDDLMGFANGADSIFGRLLQSFGFTSEEIEDLRKSFRALADAIGSLFSALKPVIGAVVLTAFKAISAVLVGIVAVIGMLVTGLVKAWEKVRQLAQAAQEFWQSLSDAFSSIPDAISDALSSAWDMVVAWFGKWAALIFESIGAPIKSIFEGIGKFFGFGSDPNDASTMRTQEGVAVRQAGLQAASPTIRTNANMEVVNNITTRDDPRAISKAIGSTVGAGFEQQASLIGQSMSGVNLK